MSLQPGTRLGPYEVTAAIGAGGMGEVYQARDTALNRDVAIKVLPDSLAGDADRLARFQREAEALAALNHPNIAQVYGLEKSGETPAIVMELVEGPTLADRIKAGPIPLDEALPIARQIAEALEAAHERGIIHRDLKPANIKVKDDGRVKVLDFGLAKAVAPPDELSPNEMNSPTVTAHDTRQGVILGTAAYMAPEQARGKAVDKRADVWAFGVVLLEMLMGRRAFDAREVTDVLAAVIRDTPPFEALPEETPAPIRRLLRRCLEKDRAKRLDSMRAAQLEIDDAIAGATDDVGGPSTAAATPTRPAALPASFAAWARDGAIWVNSWQGIVRIDEQDGVTRPFGAQNSDLLLMQVLADDRTALVYRAPGGFASGPALLLDLRSGARTRLIDTVVVEIRYTAGHLVYALPDGTLEAVQFDPSTQRIDGEPVRIASDVSIPGNGLAQFVVAENGTVAIPEEPRSLVLVNRDGGSRPATDERHNFHAPRFSPDGRQISTDFNSPDGRDVWVLDLDTGLLTRATFDRDGHDATWMPDGQSMTYTSSVVPGGVLGLFRTRPGSAEAEPLLAAPGVTYTGLSLSDGSALVTTASGFEPGSAGDIGIIRNGGRGPIEPLVATRFLEKEPAISYDDRWLAFVSNLSGQDQVYVRPLGRDGAQVRVSLSGGNEPVWSPDGRELSYRAGVGEGSQLMVASVVTDSMFAVTSRQALFAVTDVATATPHGNYDVSADGQTFVMVRRNPPTRIMVIQNLPALVQKLSGPPSAR